MTMRKIFLISFLFLIALMPDLSAAAGLVPCGPGTEKSSCELCDLFALTNNLIKFFFQYLVTTAAVLMLVIGGALFFLAGPKPDMVNQAKGIITSVIVGLLIIFAAWVIINTVFGKLNVINMPSGWKWYEISCR